MCRNWKILKNEYVSRVWFSIRLWNKTNSISSFDNAFPEQGFKVRTKKGHNNTMSWKPSVFTDLQSNIRISAIFVHGQKPLQKITAMGRNESATIKTRKFYMSLFLFSCSVKIIMRFRTVKFLLRHLIPDSNFNVAEHWEDKLVNPFYLNIQHTGWKCWHVHKLFWLLREISLLAWNIK